MLLSHCPNHGYVAAAIRSRHCPGYRPQIRADELSAMGHRQRRQFLLSPVFPTADKAEGYAAAALAEWQAKGVLCA